VFNNNTRLSNGNIEKFLRNTDDEFFSNNIDKIFEKINKEINLSTGISNEHYIMQPAYQLVYKAINS
jgi:hypothetical protein